MGEILAFCGMGSIVSDFSQFVKFSNRGRKIHFCSGSSRPLFTLYFCVPSASLPLTAPSPDSLRGRTEYPSGLSSHALIRPLDRLPRPQRRGHVDHPLVPAAPPGQGQGPLVQQEGAVHQHVQLLQQGPLGRRPLITQVLEGPAAVAPHVQAVPMGDPRQTQAVLRLGEGLAAGEGQPVGEGEVQLS